jgi:hypothetical protein
MAFVKGKLKRHTMQRKETNFKTKTKTNTKKEFLGGS